MRTDVKVGLVCVFAVVLAVVCYFAMHDNKAQVVTNSLPAHTAVEGKSTGTDGGLTITPTTAPSAAAGGTVEPSMTPTLAGAGGSLLGPSAAYGQTTPPGSVVISPPGASTAPSMGGNTGAGGNVGMTSPGSLNTPLIPSPGLTSSGATTMGSSLATPMTPGHEPMSGGESSTGGLLPPMSSSGGSMSHAGTTGSHGAIDLTPHRSTIDLTPAPGGFGEPSLMGVTPSDSSGTYTIAKGDTFGSLAKKNGVTIKAIEAANPGVNSSHLKIGQKIKMPSASSAASSGSVTTSRPASSSRTATTKKSTKSKGSTTKASGAKAVAGGTYTVKKGDTLRKIAKAVYGDESLWQRIFRANRGDMSDANDLTVGQVIKLPATK